MRAILASLILLFLAACGTKGPLYLPMANTNAAALTTSAPATPAAR